MDHRHDDHHASDIHAAIILVIIFIAYALMWSAGASRFYGVGPSIRFEHAMPAPSSPPPQL
jgi:hypothetical protein